MSPQNREEILARLHAKIARGEVIVGGGAGTGISAKCEEAGGIDLVVIYNYGRSSPRSPPPASPGCRTSPPWA